MDEWNDTGNNSVDDDLKNAFQDIGVAPTLNNSVDFQNAGDEAIISNADTAGAIDFGNVTVSENIAPPNSNISIENWGENENIDLNADIFKNSEPGSDNSWAADYTQMEDTVPLDEYEASQSSWNDVATDTQAELSADNEIAYRASDGGGDVYVAEHNFIKWYSGSVHDEMFEISKSNIPENMVGDENKSIIHVDVGYDSYGWLVEFSDGVAMSLEDVRKYQIKNGMLPSSEGVIRYGQYRCTFSAIKRILIYKNVRYFSYGI